MLTVKQSVGLYIYMIHKYTSTLTNIAGNALTLTLLGHTPSIKGTDS